MGGGRREGGREEGKVGHYFLCWRPAITTVLPQKTFHIFMTTKGTKATQYLEFYNSLNEKFAGTK